MPRHPGIAATSATLTGGVFSASSLARRARERGDVHRLHMGDTYLEPPAPARVQALPADEGLHVYSPVHGEPELLAAIVARHPGLDRNDVQVMTGATGGLNAVCQSLLEPGDEVLILAPFWPLIRGIVAMRGAVPVEVPFYDRLGDPGLDAVLETTITERTVAIYVNSPNNPFGCILDAPAVDAIATAAREHDLWLFCDEAYEDIYFGDTPPEPMWHHPDLADRALVTHTLSKSYGLAGGRIGYTHGPRDAMRVVRGVQTFDTYCASRPMQLAAASALTHGAGWLAEARRLYAAAAQRSAEALGVPVPAGGTFLFFDTRTHRRRGEDTLGFLERCVDIGVLMMPGANAGRDYADWVRLCFTVIPPDALDDALDKLSSVLSK